MIFQTLNLKKKKNSLRKKSFREKKRRQAARIKSVREISIELFVIFQLVWILDNRSIDIIELCVELKRRARSPRKSTIFLCENLVLRIR